MGKKSNKKEKIVKELVMNAFSLLESSILLGQTNAQLEFVLCRHNLGAEEKGKFKWVVGKLDSDKLVSNGYKKSSKILGLQVHIQKDKLFYPTDVNNFLSLAPLDAIISVKFGKTIVFQSDTHNLDNNANA